MAELKDLVNELMSLNNENLSKRVINDNDVQWCLSELYDMLAIDVVEVVRCGECKFYSPVEGDIGDCRRREDHQRSQRQFPLRPGLHGAHILSKDGAFLHCIKGSQTCQEKNGPRRTLSTGGRFQSISLYISL